MSTNQTANCNLSQWVKSDQVRMEDFNADNAKIDAALGSLAASVAGKASASALSSLQSTVSSHSGSLAGKGNCQIYYTTYVGNGNYGSGQPSSFSFPHKPLMIFVTDHLGYQGAFIRGSDTHYVGSYGSGGNFVKLTWGNKSVQWYSAQSANVQLNVSGWTYQLVALLQADD